MVECCIESCLFRYLSITILSGLVPFISESRSYIVLFCRLGMPCQEPIQLHRDLQVQQLYL